MQIAVLLSGSSSNARVYESTMTDLQLMLKTFRDVDAAFLNEDVNECWCSSLFHLAPTSPGQSPHMPKEQRK